MGRLTGIVETSYPLGSLLGFPVVGWLLHSYGWEAPYIMLVILFTPFAIALLIFFPKQFPSQLKLRTSEVQPTDGLLSDSPSGGTAPFTASIRRLLSLWREAIGLRTSIFGLPAVLGFSYSNALVVSSFGQWTHDEYASYSLAFVLSCCYCVGLALIQSRWVGE